MKAHGLKLFLFLIIFSSALLNTLTLKDGHNWGEDFAQYIIHAKNILKGESYGEGIMVDNSLNYPPGFPFILAIVIKTFGLDFKILKWINVFFWYAMIGVLWFGYKDRIGRPFLYFNLVFLALSSYFFTFKQNILSDIPFLFFVIFSVVSMAQYQKTFRNNWLQAAILTALISYWIRSAGLALLMAIFFYLIFAHRKYKPAGILAVLTILCAWLQGKITHFSPGFLTFIASQPVDFLMASFKNSTILLQSLAYFFITPQATLTKNFYIIIEHMLNFVPVFIYGAFFVKTFLKIKSRQLSFEHLFFLFYLLLIVFWGGFLHLPGDFSRYILPLAVIGLFHLDKVFYPSGKEWRKITVGFLSLIMVVNIYNIIINFHYNDDVILKNENQEMFAWVKDHVAVDEHYMVMPARVVACLTERVGTSFWNDPAKPFWLDRIKALRISYVIFHKKTQQPLVAIAELNPDKFLFVWQNSVFKIFKVTY